MYATILLCVDNKGKEKMDWGTVGFLGNIKPPFRGVRCHGMWVAHPCVGVVALPKLDGYFSSPNFDCLGKYEFFDFLVSRFVSFSKSH